jgi:hypothetical protein
MAETIVETALPDEHSKARRALSASNACPMSSTSDE